MHEEAYPAFFTPRDEEPSLSSSEEKSSEFDWLEIKITRKTKIYMKNRASALQLYFLLIQKVVSKNKLPRDFFSDYIIMFCKENYKLYIRGYSPFVLA